jgi:hypothetical protein
MSILTIDTFINRNLNNEEKKLNTYSIYHKWNEDCNQLENYEGLDQGIATVTSICFWIMLLAIGYEVGSILVPGLPPGVKPFIKQKQKKKNKHKNENENENEYSSNIDAEIDNSNNKNNKIDDGKEKTSDNTSGNNNNNNNDDDDDDDDNENNFKSWYGIHRWLKLGSYISPDLLWATLASNYLYDLTKDVPSSTGYYVPSIKDIVINEKQNSIKLRKHLISSVQTNANDNANDNDNDNHFSTVSHNANANANANINTNTNTNNVFPIDLEKNSNSNSSNNSNKSDLINIMMKPPFPTFSIEVSCVEGYATINICCNLIRNTYIWKNIYLDKTITGNKYILNKILRSSGELVFTQTYDIASNGYYTDGRNGKNLTNELNNIDDKYIIVIMTTHNPTWGHRDNGLPEAIYRCGGTKDIFYNKLHSSGYILIGIPGHGHGSGYETFLNKTRAKVNKDTRNNVNNNNNIDYSNGVLSVAFRILHMKSNTKGFEKIDDIAASSQNENEDEDGDEDEHKNKHGNEYEYGHGYGHQFLKAAFTERTLQENLKWKEYLSNNMPSYYSLSLLEYDELISIINKNDQNQNQDQFQFQDQEDKPSYLEYFCCFFIIIGFGHILTNVGRRAWKAVFWKYITFFPLY